MPKVWQVCYVRHARRPTGYQCWAVSPVEGTAGARWIVYDPTNGRDDISTSGTLVRMRPQDGIVYAELPELTPALKAQAEEKQSTPTALAAPVVAETQAHRPRG